MRRSDLKIRRFGDLTYIRVDNNAAKGTRTLTTAGNRLDAGSVFDNLNRPTSLEGVAVTSDVLGNRTTLGANTYGWDGLNRLTSYNGASYAYRADGMRVRKENSSGATLTRYDGQMPVQDAEYGGSGAWQKTTDYAIGARGVDAMSVNGNVTYPLYDAHGNMISTLSKNGGGYTYSALRIFDAWGRVRLGATTGDPKGRYCANLGHVQDDESGLVYMRARYYEPGTGRFISQDRTMSGANWFVYANNNPVSGVDPSGDYTVLDVLGAFAKVIGGVWASYLAVVFVESIVYAMGAALVMVLANPFLLVPAAGVAVALPLMALVKAGKEIHENEGLYGEKGGRKGGLLREVVGFYTAMSGIYELSIMCLSLEGQE